MDSVQLTEKQKEQLQRYQFVFIVWLENPWMSDKALREFLVNTYGISVIQAYQDIKNVQILLGNVKRAVKEWYCYIENNYAANRDDFAATVQDEFQKQGWRVCPV